MASRGLPGFLRRSLRRDLDDEEEEDNSNYGSTIEQPQKKKEEEGEEVALEESSSNEKVAEQPAEITSSPFAVNENTASLNISSELAPDLATANTVNEPMEDHSQRSTVSSTGHHNSRLLSDSWQHIPSPGLPNLHHQQPVIKSYREIQYEKVLGADVVDLAVLRKLAWNGIPPVYRATTWKLLLGYWPTNAARREQNLRRRRHEYCDAIAQHYDINDDSRTLQEQETLRQVLVDVPRTAPDVPLFRNDRIRRILTRLLYIWAMRHPASSYVQGINDLATPLVSVFLADYFDHDVTASGQPNKTGGIHYGVLDGHVMNHLSDEHLDQLEADVYWCLTNLLAGIQDHYTSDQPGVQRMVLRLEELVNRIDADLARHFRETGIEFLQFAFKWMNCLLLREFSLKCVFRLWDTYLSEKDGFEGFHVYVCAAFLCQFSLQLQEMSFDELFGFLQSMQTSDWTDTEIEVLLSQAYVLSTLFGGSDAHLTSNSVSR